MEIEILEKVENPILKRVEVKFKLTHEEAATPSRETVIAKLAAMLNADRDRTILKKIDGTFGLQYSFGEANLYDNATDALEIEPKHILKRNALLVVEEEKK